LQSSCEGCDRIRTRENKRKRDAVKKANKPPKRKKTKAQIRADWRERKNRSNARKRAKEQAEFFASFKAMPMEPIAEFLRHQCNEIGISNVAASVGLRQDLVLACMRGQGTIPVELVEKICRGFQTDAKVVYPELEGYYRRLRRVSE
jgi:hypothetical protein